QSVQVREVLVPPEGALVLPQFLDPDERCRHASHLQRLPPRVRRLEVHPLTARKEVDPGGGVTQLDDPVRYEEVLRSKPYSAEAEVAQRTQQALGVLGRALDPHVEVLRAARMPVERNGIPTDDEVPDLTRVQRCDKLAEVAAQHHSARRGIPAGWFRGHAAAPRASAPASR